MEHKDSTRLCIFIVVGMMVIKLSALVIIYTHSEHIEETEHQPHHIQDEKKYYKTNHKTV